MGQNRELKYKPMHTQLLFEKGVKITQWRNNSILINIHMQNNVNWTILYHSQILTQNRLKS